jgi:hypothetical protein
MTAPGQERKLRLLFGGHLGLFDLFPIVSLQVSERPILLMSNPYQN